MNKPLLGIILCSVLIKAWLTFGVVKNIRLPWDEDSAWSAAENKNAGRDYIRYYKYIGEYRKTAFHGSFTVMLYDFFIRHDIPKNAWIIFVHSITFLLFALSVYYFYWLASLYINNEKIKLLCTATYAFYPSVIYYLGSLLLYENFTMYLLIIALYKLSIAYNNTSFKRSDLILLPLIICISCLFRPHFIIMYTIIGLLYLLLSKNKRSFAIILLTAFIATALCFIPTVQKNKKLFGAYILSTQGGFEILQGHNPTARGSWMHHWEKAGNPFYEYAHTNIPGLDSLNEYESSLARKQLAIDWIVAHPVEELVLTARKIAIYFLPSNYEELDQISVLNAWVLFMHLLFFAGLGYFIVLKKINRQLLILCFPIIASLVLTIIFYVGYRWRFYAEPFMILLAWIFLEKITRKKHTSPQ